MCGVQSHKSKCKSVGRSPRIFLWRFVDINILDYLQLKYKVFCQFNFISLINCTEYPYSNVRLLLLDLI